MPIWITFEKMRMINVIGVWLVAFVLMSVFACTEKPDTGFTPSFRLQLNVMHHTWGVGNCAVYLKYDAADFPGTETRYYDDSVFTDPDGVAVFEELYYGNYFVYAYGYDAIFGDTVTGNGLVKLTQLNVQSGQMDTVLLVSE